MREVGAALVGLGEGEVVADAGAADAEAVQERAALDGVDVGVGRGSGVAGEVVAGRVDGVEAQLGAEVDRLLEGHGAAAQRGVERVEVAAQLDLRGAGGGWLLFGGSQRNGRETSTQHGDDVAPACGIGHAIPAPESTAGRDASDEGRSRYRTCADAPLW